MKPEKDEQCNDCPFKDDFDKKLGRLKLVEESIREHGYDMQWGDMEYVNFESDKFSMIVEELQAVIAEIEKEMTG